MDGAPWTHAEALGGVGEPPAHPTCPFGFIGMIQNHTRRTLVLDPSKAGIEIWMWVHCLLETYRALGVTSGPVFRVAQKGSKVR